MSSSHHTHTEGEYIPETYVPHSESHGTKSLWRTFWILLAITLVDFVIYFCRPKFIQKHRIYCIWYS
jgi:hypothetical protein